MSDGADALALFAEDMRSDDIEVRTRAVGRLKLVAAALGPAATLKDLLPLLNEYTGEEDEVLLGLADALGPSFVRLLGGAAHAAALLPPLAALAAADETVVRDKAVESAAGVVALLSPEAALEHAVPLLQRLAGADWFTSRVAAAGLLRAAYERVGDPDARRILRGLFASLAADETPMVRRAAARALPALVPALERDALLADVVPAFLALASEEPDSVRVLAVDAAAPVARALAPPDAAAAVLPLLAACARDKSWRVRHAVAREFAAIADAVGAPGARAELLPLLAGLLRDPEAEVRAAAARAVARFARLVGPDALTGVLLPALRALAGADSPPAVKAAVAGAAMDLPALVAMDADTTARALVPLVDRLLADDADDVKLRLLAGVAGAAPALSRGYLEAAVLPTLERLGGDPLWRVRERVITQLPLLVQTLGGLNDRLLNLFLGTYVDPVHAVRMAGARATQALAVAFGADWVRGTLVPHLRDLFTAPGASYLQRITVVHAIEDLVMPGPPAGAPPPPPPGDAAGGGPPPAPRPGAAPGSPLAVVAEDVLPVLLGALADPVPNVRFVGARALRAAVGAKVYSLPRIAADILPPLAALAEGDADPDVRHFAACALEVARG